DGKVHEKIVGEKVSLTAEILPSDLTVTSKKWTVPENRVKNYTATLASADKTPLEEKDLNDTSVSYYWVDGARSRDVKFSVKIDLGNNEAFEKEVVATYAVAAPTTTMTAVSGDVFLGTSTINCGIPGIKAGIKITRTTSSSPVGTFEFWQVGTSSLTEWTVKSGWKFRGSGTNRIDDYPGPHYREDSVGVMTDSPQMNFHAIIQLQPGDEYIALTTTTHFRTWIMFKPAGNDSIYVPLRSLKWYWTGAAKLNSAGVWVKGGELDTKVTSASQETTDFPEWSGTLRGIPVMPIRPSNNSKMKGVNYETLEISTSDM
ncbi:MAG: hypothetical protein HP043_03335, partial [Dialister sp.]|nr:hypothetical protein [Dialister sp.]